MKSRFPDLKNIFSLNCDLIFNLTKENFSELERVHEKTAASATLLGFNVNGRNDFNRLDVEGSFLKNIINISNPDARSYDYTYSGIGIFDLEKLDARYNGRESNFFDSVAPFQNKSVAVHLPGVLDYYDFGTLENYLNSIKMIRDDRNSFIRKFLSPEMLKHNRENFIYSNDLLEVIVSNKDLRVKLKT